MPDPAMQRLRDVAAAASAGQPVAPDLATWFVAAVSRYEARAGSLGLDVVLGLGAPGRHGWWTREARGKRNDALRRLRAECFPSVNDADAAERIAAMLGGVHHPLLTEALRSGLGIPGQKQLASILAGKSADA